MLGDEVIPHGFHLLDDEIGSPGGNRGRRFHFLIAYWLGANRNQQCQGKDDNTSGHDSENAILNSDSCKGLKRNAFPNRLAAFFYILSWDSRMELGKGSLSPPE